MITHKKVPWAKNEIRVCLDKRLVGSIRPIDSGYAYFPRADNTIHGDIFPHSAQVQKSIESEG